ncbi:GDSL-type esterase/lipase family protein [Kitasatospora sp. NBC_01302]|uniref:GDSL-type esterase/lipase family protein n=1 Tax=Kitasatospora sp. NBC_01302 TaxID=2903575 RepID=UPI002E1552F6|nr:GDSL-type esterase/lipase family protein [Kitasatospora sp. NBC_01302]
MPPRTRPSAGRLLPAVLLATTVLAGCATTGTHTSAALANAAPAQASAVSTPTSASATAPSSDTVVVIGASVSGGYRAYPTPAWPTALAARLEKANDPVTVVNASIGSTRLLADNGPSVPNSLGREDKDALDVPGVSTIVLTDLINDIQQTPHQYNADAITTGIKEFAARAHARHVRVVVTTISPYGGYMRYEDAGEQTREKVNQFIRHSHAIDGYIDFDAALKDPADPTRLRPAYDSDDHLHPNGAGHSAMTQSIDLALFNPSHGNGHGHPYRWAAAGVLALGLALGALGLLHRRRRHRH